ncbi:hypothetical protein PS914_06771 [Pseudomonas fluorescens]|nr:hypothetical protein PS914_06771 [Pseudomonas fluorescens]
MATFFVSRTAQRRDAFAGDLAGFFKNGFDGFGIDGLGQRRQYGPEPGDLEYFIEDEAHIAQGGLVFGHVHTSLLYKWHSIRRSSGATYQGKYLL